MGSKFLQSGLDPIGSVISRAAGPNSWYARMQSYDPLVNSGVGKTMLSSNYNLGQQYANRRNPAVGYQAPPTPFAGQDPSLRDANAGYVAAANDRVNKQNQVWQNGSSYGQ